MLSLRAAIADPDCPETPVIQDPWVVLQVCPGSEEFPVLAVLDRFFLAWEARVSENSF